MTETTSNIFTAINAIMAEVGYVKKQRSDGLRYSYAGERSLIAALRPEMYAQGVFCYVETIEDIQTREYSNDRGTNMTNVTMTGYVRFVHAPSGTSILVAARGEGMDAGDKASNKAMTDFYKYALRQTFMIETGDDPDAFDPSEYKRGEPAEPAEREGTQVLGEPEKIGAAPDGPAKQRKAALEAVVTPGKKVPLGSYVRDDLEKLKMRLEVEKDEKKLKAEWEPVLTAVTELLVLMGPRTREGERVN